MNPTIEKNTAIDKISQCPSAASPVCVPGSKNIPLGITPNQYFMDVL